ncbi:hypothetical protein INT48_006612 [Thamnidium elegans]|uniref:Cystinosin n=1 Tax=Thamnidium elegans TaxID=101142 RepID=A0A8H7SZS6_9FUNG|nr:hypothetical protein INT48_006612 [Thamnidium elegans]
MDHLQPNKLWPYVSSLIGWCYFLAWSFSFYPQVILNWKRKSYLKLTVSLIKYIPQDCTGGILSNAQLLLDAYLSGDWSGVAGNPVKLGLGLQSIAFDLVFIIQHYILYRDRTDKYLHTVEEERRRLIAEGRVPRAEDEENHTYL